jgi:hypothetical protein
MGPEQFSETWLRAEVARTDVRSQSDFPPQYTEKVIAIPLAC